MPGESSADFLPLDVRQAVQAGQKPVETPLNLDAFINADIVNGEKVKGIGWSDDDLKLAAFDLTEVLLGIQLQPDAKPTQKQEDTFAQTKALLEKKRRDLQDEIASRGETADTRNQLRELDEFERNIIAVVDRNLHPEKFVTEEKKDPVKELRQVLMKTSESTELTKVVESIQQAISSPDKNRQLIVTKIEEYLKKLETNLTTLERFIPAHGPGQDPAQVEEMRKVVVEFLDEKRRTITELRDEIFKEWKVRFHILQKTTELQKIIDKAAAGTPDQLLIDLETYKKNLKSEKGTVAGYSSYEEYIQTYLSKIDAVEPGYINDWQTVNESVGRGLDLNTAISKYERKFHGGGAYDYSSATDADLVDLNAIIAALTAPGAGWTEAQQKRWAERVKILTDHKTQVEKTLTERKRGAEFLSLLASAEQDPPKKFKMHEDEVNGLLTELERKLGALKETLIESDFQKMEVSFSLFKFRYIKYAILNQIYSDMQNDSSHNNYVGKEQEALFENKLIDLQSTVNELRRKGSIALALEMESDLDRFKKEFTALRLAFYSGSELAPQIVGAKDSTAGAQRKIPLQTIAWFPNTEDLSFSFKGNDPLAVRDELKFNGEKSYNEKLTEREYLVPDFDNPGSFIRNEHFVPSILSDGRRIMDMISRNTLYARMDSKIRERGGGPSAEETEVLGILKSQELFRSIHIGQYNEQILPKVMICAEKTLYGEEMDRDIARTVWYEHILLLHLSAMAPSSPSTDDQIYKALQPIKYIAEGALAGTSAASPFHTAAVVGVYDSAYDAQGGTAFVLDRYVVREKDLSPAKGYLEKIGMGLSGVQVEKGLSKNRQKVIHALKEEHLYDEFAFLADLPLMVSHATVWGTIPFVPAPLQYMLFREDNGPTYATNQKIKDNKTEVSVKRWATTSPDSIPRPVTAADYVTPVEYTEIDKKTGALVQKTDYDILYEEIPLERVLESTTLDKWYNNGKNIENLRKMLFDPSSEDIFDPTKVAALQNDAKYISSFLPDEIGMNVSAGTFDAQKVFQRLTIVSVFARCVDLLTTTDLSLEKAEDKIMKLMRVLGEGMKNTKAIDAIIISLKQILGTEEESQRSAQLMLDQVTAALKFQR